MTATAAAVAFVVYSCKGKLEMTGTVDLEATPVQTVDDMFVVQTENGLLQMRLESPLMERYENDSLSYELFPKGLAVYGERRIRTVGEIDSWLAKLDLGLTD